MRRVTFQLILFLILPLACGSPENSDVSRLSQRQQQVKRYVDMGWNSRNLSALGEVLADGYVRSLNGIPVVKGTVELKAYILNYQRAFPDLKVTVDHWIQSGEQVVTVWTFDGTNTGEFGEYVPTGKKAIVSGVSLFILDDENRIKREDTYYNELYLLQQLGYSLIPPNLE